VGVRFCRDYFINNQKNRIFEVFEGLEWALIVGIIVGRSEKLSARIAIYSFREIKNVDFIAVRGVGLP